MLSRSLAVFVFSFGLVCAQPAYDLLLKNGHLIDPKNKISAKRDIGIKDGKVAEVAASIPDAKAHKVVDVNGLYITPGLVDLHVHVYASAAKPSEYCGQLSVFPDDHSFRSGVTTMVDAGTSGWRSFPEFKERVIDHSKTRVLSLLNIVGAGMCGSASFEQNMSDMDSEATAAMAKKHSNIVVGIKTAHFAGPEWTAVDRAVQAGKLANIPIMVDFGAFRVERKHEDLVLDHLRAGDMYTHLYLGNVPMLDQNNKVREYLWQARKRGVLFDVGHGGGSFIWWQAVYAMQQGFTPDSISTDLHHNSMNAGMKDMLNVMSKFLAMNMSLDDVILRSTWNPARQIKREDLGHLSVGAVADIAVLRVNKGDFGFVDIAGGRMKGTQKLSAEITLKDGKVYWDANGLTRQDWDKIGPRYTSQGDKTWDATISGAPPIRK